MGIAWDKLESGAITVSAVVERQVHTLRGKQSAAVAASFGAQQHQQQQGIGSTVPPLRHDLLRPGDVAIPTAIPEAASVGEGPPELQTPVTDIPTLFTKPQPR